ncbi:MAG: GNAT family N-acetyltransferase [Pseudomonadales bacterium]
MNVEIRPARAEEMEQMGAIGAYVYSGSYGDTPDNIIAQSNQPQWTLCAFVGGRMVSSYSTIPFTMRANGNAVPLGGVSAVGTLPEFRRQGIIRRITTQSFANMRERGQAVAALWASQAAIYQRYQYALATVLRSYTLDTVDIRFHDGDEGSDQVERIDLESGYDIIKSLYIQFATHRMCYLHRAKPLWLNNVLEERSADGPIHIAVSKDATGEASGYVVYTVRAGRTDHPARSAEMIVRELVWLTPDAYRSLWCFLARHDLVGRVRWQGAPLDDPAAELFFEPRLLNTRDREGIWLRVVDAPVALANRGYDAQGTITISIHEDQLAPWNNGVYRLDAGPDGAEVSEVSGDGDIRLNSKALASLYTGFRSARELAGWGLLKGSGEAVRRADALFATAHSPHCPDHF